MNYDRPRKNPFELIATRPSSNGMMVTIIKDTDEGVYWTGYGLTLENFKTGGPYGVRTFYDEDDARNTMEDLT